jgi:hypothetical protein
MNDGHPTNSPLTPKAIAARLGIQLLDELAAGDLVTGDWLIVHNTSAGTRKKYNPVGLSTAFNLVTAANAFANDNRLLRSDSTGRGAQASGITVDDSDNVTIPGNLTVQGTTVTFDTETITVEDPLISLAKANAGDLVDIGVFGLYNDGTARYTGLFRDATDGAFRLFKNLTVAPTTTIATGDASFQLADLIVGKTTFSGSDPGSVATGQAVIAGGVIRCASLVAFGADRAAGGDVSLDIGKPTSTTAQDCGWRAHAYSDDNLYIDHKVGAGGTMKYRCGAGSEGGFTRTWLTVTGSSGACLWGAAQTIGGSDPGSVSAGQVTLGGGVLRIAGKGYVGTELYAGTVVAAYTGSSTGSDTFASAPYLGAGCDNGGFYFQLGAGLHADLWLFNSGWNKSIRFNKDVGLDATDKDTAAIVTEGGLSVEKSIFAGGDLKCSGVVKIDGTQVIKEQQAAITDVSAVSGTATSGGYGFVDATEFNNFVSGVNSLKTSHNNALAMLRTHGLIAT